MRLICDKTVANYLRLHCEFYLHSHFATSLRLPQECRENLSHECRAAAVRVPHGRRTSVARPPYECRAVAARVPHGHRKSVARSPQECFAVLVRLFCERSKHTPRLLSLRLICDSATSLRGLCELFATCCDLLATCEFFRQLKNLANCLRGLCDTCDYFANSLRLVCDRLRF